MALPEISFVIPLYNEAENFETLIRRLDELMSTLPFAAEVVLIDDGSKDNTTLLMHSIAEGDPRYVCVFLSRNHGHQLALAAGMKYARGGRAIMMVDGDLQDPPELIHEFLPFLDQGYEVIYGVRRKRKESMVKRFAYWAYYRIMTKIANIDLPLDTGDFALVSRRVINLLNKMPERNRYLRGMRTWIGFKQIGVEYDRFGRNAGTTKYSFGKLMSLALSGIYNFSDLPIRIMTYLGGFAIGSSLIYLITVLYKKFFWGNVPTGFTATIIILIFFGGVQMIAMGILGEYVLRIYRESQQRPLFIVDKVIQDQEEISNQG
ncbi:MAG: glycosyltransferase family 2 protein [Saprospiraceae bacterium]